MMEEKLSVEVVAKVSHEIRTLMNGIIGLLELLEDTELNHIQKEYLDLLKFLAERLLSLVNSVLDFSKMESGKYQLINGEFNLVNLIEDVVGYFKHKANKNGLDLDYKIDNEIPNIIIGDLQSLSQVLFNLLENAIKFTEEGSISLEVKKHCESIEKIGINFIVRDTGVGISNEEIKYIFEDFNQIHSPSEKNILALA